MSLHNIKTILLWKLLHLQKDMFARGALVTAESRIHSIILVTNMDRWRLVTDGSILLCHIWWIGGDRNIIIIFPVKSPPSKPPSLESESHFCQMSLSPTNLWSHAGLDFCVCVVMVFIADVWALWQCASYHTHAHSVNSGNYSINDKNIPQTTLTACSALGTSHNQHNRIRCVMSKCVVASEFHYTNAWLVPLYMWSFFIFILFQFFIFFANVLTKNVLFLWIMWSFNSVMENSISISR